MICAGMAGCKSKGTAAAGGVQEETAAPASTTTAAATGVVIRMARPDELGKDAVCPVMGTRFKVTAITQAADYKGKTYYFCCNACPPEFQKNPDRYAK